MAIRALIVTLVVGLAGLYAQQLAAGRAFTKTLPQLEQLPRSFDGWISEDVPLADNVAAVLAADVTLQRVYRNADGAQVWVFLGYFAQQQVNSQIHSPRHCIPGGGWEITSTETETLQLARGPASVARMQLAHRGSSQQELFYWFKTRSGIVTGEYALKWDLVRNAMARRPTDAVFIRYSAPLEHDQALREFMARLDPNVETLLSEVGLE